MAKIGVTFNGKLISVFFVANFLLWVYFAIAFSHASYAYRPDLQGDPNGTGYTFWGHSIGLVESGLVYPFYRVMYYVEFPSFIVAVFVIKIFDPNLAGNWFFLGISEGGWILVATMLLSFLQWYLIICVVHRLWKSSSWSKKTEGNQLTSPNP